mgnify:CR=1 FL=1
MIVKYVDGSVTDTDKLNDLSAQLVEVQNQYTEFMCSHKIPFFAIAFDPTTNKYHPSIHAMNQKDWDIILNSMNQFFSEYGVELISKTPDSS